MSPIGIKEPGMIGVMEPDRSAVLQWIKDHRDGFGFHGRSPPIDLFFLVSKSPIQSEDEHKARVAYNGQILTYEGLIVNAKKAYEEYLQFHAKTSRIRTIISRLSIRHPSQVQHHAAAVHAVAEWGARSCGALGKLCTGGCASGKYDE